MLIGACLSAVLWLALLATPWRPWSTRERLVVGKAPPVDVSDVTVLIPARDEAGSIGTTLDALRHQGALAGVVVVDDQSSDGTAERARASGIEGLTVVGGEHPPPGWSGKLWALHQGYRHVHSPYVLLLDADIELAPGALPALRHRLDSEGLALASVMAKLHMENRWERLLLPPFIYFFKLIYPFALSNDPRSPIAAAAGGCILIAREHLDAIGGFAALHDAIIDDCTLARLVKLAGGRTWIGLSHDVRAIRPYATLGNIWNMVARTAYTQLRYSPVLLAVCSALLLLAFVVPVAGLFAPTPAVTLASAVAVGAMALTYLPTIRYYDLPVAWVATLPLAACLFLAMTWTSALRYLAGERSRWKDRSYDRISDA